VLIIGGTGYLYGGLIGGGIFKLMQDWIANLTPQYLQFWIGLLLVFILLVGPDRIGLWTRGVCALPAGLTHPFAPGAAPAARPPAVPRGGKTPEPAPRSRKRGVGRTPRGAPPRPPAPP